MFQKIKWIFHPIFIFVFLASAIIATFLLYIYWYIEITEGLNFLIKTFDLDPGQVLKTQSGFVFLIISMLAGIILFSMCTAFIYYRKTLNLYRLQYNFINNFTHELRTPVTSINLYLETLFKHDISTKDSKKYISYMLSDVDKLSNNINRILNLAKLESDFYESNLILIDIVKIIKNFYNKNKYLFKQTKIKINNNLKQKFYIKANLSLFEILLMNVTINAIKYNKKKDKEFNINISRKNKKLIIEFKDNGIGIKKSELKKIFRKFYQITTINKQEGSGLGLYFIKNIVKIHKWQIKVVSVENIGSTFILIINFDETINK